MYISFAKEVKPVLEESSVEFLAEKWTEIRQRDLKNKKNTGGVRILPITIRTYETLIRLATAHAKLRLS